MENTPEINEERAANFVDASAVQGKLSKSEKRDMGKFNIIKAMNEARNGRLTGIEAEFGRTYAIKPEAAAFILAGQDTDS